MANIRAPRNASMQFWPRVRAKKETPRVRNHITADKAVVLGFAGYKAGMTQVSYIDGRKTSPTKGETLVTAATIIECPPLYVVGIRYFKNTDEGVDVVNQITAPKLPKEIKARLGYVGSNDVVKSNEKPFDFIRLLVGTQPAQTGIGKKISDLFEISLGGSKDDQDKYAQTVLGKQIALSDVFKIGDVVDSHSVTKGKGFQGPVKRFGIHIRQHKSEKTKRGPGSLGGWVGQGHVMYRVAHAGQMGYHLRSALNQKILYIGSDVEKVNPKGGFVKYGQVKTTYMVLKGSIGGPKKRLVRFTFASRNNKHLAVPMSLDWISTDSQQ